MLYIRKYRTVLFPLLIACSGLIFICLLEYLGAFEGITTYLYDSAFRLRGSRNPSEKVIIAAIDEKTLNKLGRWPIKRTHYASLFDTMKQATVISVDVIMTEPSNDDFQVAETAARNENVILAVYLNSALNKVDPVQALSSLRNGHVHVEESIDSVVRGMFHTISTQDMILHSLTSLMCETMTSSVMRREKSADRKSLQAGGKIVFQTDQRRRKNHAKPPGSRTSRHFSSY